MENKIREGGIHSINLNNLATALQRNIFSVGGALFLDQFVSFLLQLDIEMDRYISLILFLF